MLNMSPVGLSPEGEQATRSVQKNSSTASRVPGEGANEVSVEDNTPVKLSEYKVWKYMLTSRRTVVATFSILVYGYVFQVNLSL